MIVNGSLVSCLHLNATVSTARVLLLFASNLYLLNSTSAPHFMKFFGGFFRSLLSRYCCPSVITRYGILGSCLHWQSHAAYL